MADFSYSGAPTSTDLLELVRLAIGDTDKTRQLYQDQTINAVLAIQPDVTKAACALVRGLIARFSRDVDKDIGETSIKASQRVAHYRALLADLQAGGSGLLPGGDGTGVPNTTPYAGGMSISEAESMAEDTDYVQNAFGVGRDDHPGTVQDGISVNERWRGEPD